MACITDVRLAKLKTGPEGAERASMGGTRLGFLSLGKGVAPKCEHAASKIAQSSKHKKRIRTLLDGRQVFHGRSRPPVSH